MANTLKLEIVTPDATVYSGDVHMVTLPAVEGQVGIYPRHVPLLTRIVPGEIIVRKNGDEQFLAVGHRCGRHARCRESPSLHRS